MNAQKSPKPKTETKLRKPVQATATVVPTAPVPVVVAPVTVVAPTPTSAPVVPPVRPSDPARAPSRRLTETEVTARLGSVAVNVSRDGSVTVKVQGFLPLDVALGVETSRKSDESRTEALERLVRIALGTSIPEVTPEVMAAVGRAHATRPVSPSEQARRAAAPAKRTLVTL